MEKPGTDPIPELPSEPVGQQKPLTKQHVFTDSGESCDPEPVRKGEQPPSGDVLELLEEATQQETQDSAPQKDVQHSSDPPEKTRDPIQPAPKQPESDVSAPCREKSSQGFVMQPKEATQSQQEPPCSAPQKGVQQSSDPPEKSRDPLPHAPKQPESDVSKPVTGQPDRVSAAFKGRHDICTCVLG